MSDSAKKSVGIRKSSRVVKVSKDVAEAKVNVESLKKAVKQEVVDEPSSEEEVSDQDDADVGSEPSFGPAALGLHRVGTALPKRKKAVVPSQALNNRGIPARIKKKNPLFYDDNMVNDQKQIKNSPKKNTPVKTTPKVKSGKKLYVKRAASAEGVSVPAKKHKSASKKRKEADALENAIVIPVDKKLGQRIGLRLRNLLKLPKAHKFVSYEWFYSTIDRAILGGENDFEQCLREYYPTLVTRDLTRAEWNHIRRTMGKPRRCSQTFFDEERRELERRRQKIRLLQTRKAGDPSFVRDLPKEIPMPLGVGTKVTARLRAPQDGLL